MENYEILGMVGEGSFGRVYKAKRKENNETVAVKVIRKVNRPLNSDDRIVFNT